MDPPPRAIGRPGLGAEQRARTALYVCALFVLLELVLGIRNHSLALIADALHGASDAIGLAVALLRPRAVPLGAFFHGALLGTLGGAVLLRVLERVMWPVEVTRPRFVLITGGVGIGVHMLVIHLLNARNNVGAGPAAVDLTLHIGHARRALGERKPRPALGFVGDTIGHIAVAVSACVYMSTGFLYADGLAAALVGLVIIRASYPLLRDAGGILLRNGAPSAAGTSGT